MKSVISPFNYSAIAPDVATVAQTAASLIRVSLRKQIDAVVAVGQQLISLRDALDHGQFGAWLKSEILFSETTAQNYMRVAEKIGPKSATIADLPLALVYQLSSPMVPDEVRDQILVRREGGEPVRVAEVKEIVGEAIYAAKKAAEKAAEEERRSPAAKARERAARKKRQVAREEANARYEERLKRERDATARAAELIVNRFGSDIKELEATLNQCPPFGFVTDLLLALQRAGAVS